MKHLGIICCLFFLFQGCGANEPNGTQNSTKELLVFCGITMIDPIMKLSDIFEKKHGISIKMTYGGSQDLAKSIEVNQLGDIYLPGFKKYVDEMATKGIISGSKLVGHNQIAFFVQKNNPLKITGNLNNLINPTLSVAIGHQDLGSVGREARRVLKKKKIYEAVVENAAFMASDSKGMTMGLREKRVDLVLNWRSVNYLKDNATFMDEIAIEPGYAQKHPLVMGRLIYSKHPKLADLFMDLCASDDGRRVFEAYGF